MPETLKLPVSIKRRISRNKNGENVPHLQNIELVLVRYSISDIQNYFEYIMKKHETLIDKPPVKIYFDRIQNRVTFKIKYGYYLELLMPETLKLPVSIKRRISRNKNGENVPHLQNIELVLVRYSISDIQNYFEYIMKKHETLIDKPPVKIYFDRIQNRVVVINGAIWDDLDQIFQIFNH